jgi:hypothetical protein
MLGMAELYEVLDPRPNAASAPYTFFLPDPELIKAVREDDHVKAMIRAVPPREKSGSERMWIRVTSARSDWLEGTLESQPHDMPELPQGAILQLPRSHVVDVILADAARTPPTVKPKREYWARCIVDQCVLVRELKVGYLYREAPVMTKEDDRFPDSGWRIRGDPRGASVEQLGSREVAYIALGAVLNRDDTWLHLIDEPVGARFEKDFERGIFVPEK